MNTFDLSRRQALALLGAGTAALALETPAARAAALAAPPQDAAAFLDALAWRMIELAPESATSLGIDSGAHSALRTRLGDRSAAGQARQAALLRDALQHLTAFDPAMVDPATQTSLAVVKSAFSTALDGFAMPYGDVAVGGYRNTPYAVIQNVGAYLDTPRFLDSDHPVRTAADAEAYLARLDQFPAQLDGETARIADARAKGLVPPAFLLDKTIRQLEIALNDAKVGGDLAGSLAKRTTQIPGDWERRAGTLASGPVAAALERQLAEIKLQRTLATADAGLWARPHGDEFYAWALRASTTTRRTPDEVHALGLEQLEMLHARMDPILKSLGYTQGTVGERMTALGADPRFKFPNTDQGRQQIIALMQGKIDFIRGKLPLAFRTLVRGNLEIRRLPPAEEAGAPGAYGGAGSIDGSIPGKIWLNLGDTDRHSRYSLPTLAFHEGIPGHVWQGEYANRLPLIRTLLAFNAYSEGWALYAETLGDELGAYDGDPVGQLGYLQSIAFRACRMVVDTGLHAKRWTREQAIHWFSSTNGSGLAEVTPEVDRYCSWPGQACGYKMGHSEILAQRERAKAALGGKFDLRDFDDAVVLGGNVPLDVLGDNVSRYIAHAAGG
ncbi:MAG: hypothetical protein RLZZ84_323 [Pseudomonadota bacterium]|jgi:uncharacterized protein (DUF885 family)